MAVKMKDQKHSILKSESGQAMFELIIVIPIFIVLYTVLVIFGGAVNAGINQQKAARAHFFNKEVMGNSFAPSVTKIVAQVNYERSGLLSIIWAEKVPADVPFAPCFPLLKIITEEGESCDDALEGDLASAFVKVFTAYGACSANYNRENDSITRDLQASNSGSCINR